MPTVHRLHVENVVTPIWISRGAYDDLCRHGNTALRKKIERFATDGIDSFIGGPIKNRKGGVLMIRDGSTLRLMGYMRNGHYLITRSSYSKAGSGMGSKEQSAAIEACKQDKELDRFGFSLEPL